MGGWSSGVSVGVDVGGISNPLIASFFFFFLLQALNKRERMLWICAHPSFYLSYIFFHILAFSDHVHK